MYDTQMRSSSLITDLALAAYAQAAGQSHTNSLNQLLTQSEKVTIGRRVLIAQAIVAGKTRMEINEKIGVSPNTFANIRQWIESEFVEYHSTYKTCAEPTEQERRHSTPGSPFSFDEMARRYPGHFLILSSIKKLFD